MWGTSGLSSVPVFLHPAPVAASRGLMCLTPRSSRGPAGPVYALAAGQEAASLPAGRRPGFPGLWARGGRNSAALAGYKDLQRISSKMPSRGKGLAWRQAQLGQGVQTFPMPESPRSGSLLHRIHRAPKPCPLSPAPPIVLLSSVTLQTAPFCPGRVQGEGYLRPAPVATLLVMSEVVFLKLLLSSSWLRGTELARVDTSRRSWWSSLRLRRRRLVWCSLLVRHSLLMRLCDTTSSKRCRCFLGMKILANMTGEANQELPAGAGAERPGGDCSQRPAAALAPHVGLLSAPESRHGGCVQQGWLAHLWLNQLLGILVGSSCQVLPTPPPPPHSSASFCRELNAALSGAPAVWEHAAVKAGGVCSGRARAKQLYLPPPCVLSPSLRQLPVRLLC